MNKEKADLIIINGKVYCVDSNFSIAQAFAVKGGRFIAIGTTSEILERFQSKKIIDALGKPVYPGFIDAHCHFVSYGKLKSQVDLSGTKSFSEVLNRLKSFDNKGRRWLVGRGWDQNDWPVKEFPSKDSLDILFPKTPVYLSRVDGHAALVNQAAIELAGINSETKVNGGRIILKDGKPTGVLVDNAADLVKSVIPTDSKKELKDALLTAQKNCFKVGLTTVDDAGLDKAVIDEINALQESGKLKMRIYAMVSGTPENLNYYLAAGPFKTEHLNVRSFKIYADGALGSRGACLLAPYRDRPGEQGFILNPPNFYDSIAAIVAKSKFQLNTHCIGDSANRFILHVYGKVLGLNNLRRWRIEHCQVVNREDFSLFRLYGIIPSVQPTHATSDMYWAGERLGSLRMKGAYAYKDLMDENKFIAFGSDFPVESINPILGFYAAVARKDTTGYPPNGFQMENAVSRRDALRAMTIWAAYANFEETEKGTIEPGKLADFVILNNDIMTMDTRTIYGAKPVYTFSGGVAVYTSESKNKA